MAFYRDINDETPTNQPDVLDVPAIIQSITTLLLTRKGERPFLPEYGVGISDFLFDLMNDGASLTLFGEIVDSIRVWEPRVNLEQSRSDVVADPDNNRFDITLFFTVVGFENEGLFEVSEFITG